MENIYSIDNFENAKGTYLVNSPRTLEACLRSGITPHELLPRPITSFKTETLEKSRILYEHYEMRRQEKIKLVKSERKYIIDYLTPLPGGAQRPRSPTSPSGLSPTIQLVGADLTGDQEEWEMRAANIKSHMMEMERKRIEAIRNRQQKELERIVENEKRSANAQAEQLRKDHEAMEREQKRLEDTAAKHVEQAQKQKHREEEKKKKEEEELEKRKIQVRKEAQFEKKRAKEEAERAREWSRIAQMRDEERQRKLQEKQRKSELALKAQEEEAIRNRIKMDERERLIKEQLEAKREAKKKEIEEQTHKTQLAIQAALQSNDEIQRKKRSDYEKRQEEARKHAEEQHEIKMEAVKKLTEDREAKIQHRLERLQNARKMEKDHRKDIVRRRKEKEKFLSVVSKQREEELSELKLTRSISLMDKLDNVNRIKRIDEFVKMQTLQKINTDDVRSERIKAEREYLINQRKEASREALLRKHRIQDAMELMRVTNKFDNLNTILQSSTSKKMKRRSNMSESMPNLTTGISSSDYGQRSP